MHKANIVVKQPNNQAIYISTTGKGLLTPKILQKALLRGRDRWGDTAALTRIVIAEMIQGDVLGKTGVGVSTAMMDNEQFLLVIDDRKEMIGVFGESGVMYRKLGFAEFCAIREADLEWVRFNPNHHYTEDGGLNRHRGDLYPFV